MPSPFTRRRRLDVLFDRFREGFPFVVELGGWIIEGDVLPLVALPDFDEFLSVLGEAQRAVGADDVTLVGRASVCETGGDRDAGTAVFVSDKCRGRVIAGLVVRVVPPRLRTRIALENL